MSDEPREPDDATEQPTGEQTFRWGLTPGAPESTPTVQPSTVSFERPELQPATTPVPRVPAGEAGFVGVGEAAPEASASTESPARLLRWVVGGLLALVLVVAAFFFGSLIPRWLSGSPTPEPSTVPTPTAIASPGEVAWDAMFGGECIAGFESPWQQSFTVVDCASEHTAQLVYRGTLTSDKTAFPGESSLAEQMNALCTQNGIFDVAAASAVNGLQVQAAFPVTAEQWDAGARSYYCFVNRSDGVPLSGSLAGPGPQ